MYTWHTWKHYKRFNVQATEVKQNCICLCVTLAARSPRSHACRSVTKRHAYFAATNSIIYHLPSSQPPKIVANRMCAVDHVVQRQRNHWGTSWLAFSAKTNQKVKSYKYSNVVFSFVFLLPRCLLVRLSADNVSTIFLFQCNSFPGGFCVWCAAIWPPTTIDGIATIRSERFEKQKPNCAVCFCTMVEHLLQCNGGSWLVNISNLTPHTQQTHTYAWWPRRTVCLIVHTQQHHQVEQRMREENREDHPDCPLRDSLL